MGVLGRTSKLLNLPLNSNIRASTGCFAPFPYPCNFVLEEKLSGTLCSFPGGEGSVTALTSVLTCVGTKLQGSFWRLGR